MGSKSSIIVTDVLVLIFALGAAIGKSIELRSFSAILLLGILHPTHKDLLETKLVIFESGFFF